MFAEDWAAWHAEHERRRAAPHGFLAVTGLHWLTAEPRSFDGVPGAWRNGPDGVTVRLPEGERHLGVVDEDGVEEHFGDTLVEIARRGRLVMLRPRHPDNPARLAYRGTPAFPPTEKWVLTGRFVADQRPVTVGSVVDGVEHRYAAPGRVEFEAGGLPLSLTVFAGSRPGGLSALFTDATSGVTTYPANRTLQIPPPAVDGTVVLDFNRATNLPCAYSPFATCPLPPPENRLPIAVEAGEQWPR